MNRVAIRLRATAAFHRRAAVAIESEGLKICRGELTPSIKELIRRHLVDAEKLTRAAAVSE